MDKIKVNIDNKIYEYERGVSLSLVSESYKSKFVPLACFVNNELVSLDKSLNDDCDFKFVTISDPVGNRIYQKGLIFVLVYAFKELFGYDYKIKACHSIDKAIKIRTNLPLNHKRINMLKEKMREVINSGLSIDKCLVKRKEAYDYFMSIGDVSKANTFAYTTNHYVTLYRLGDMYDYYFSPLPISTAVFAAYDLYYLDDGSFILQFPTLGEDGKIPPYVDREKILNAFDKNYKFSKRLGIFNSADINKIVSSGKISDIIKLCEVVSSNELLELAKLIESKKDTVKLILLAGPSSSGKTTTSKKLAMYLKAFGFNPKSISIDDYFVDRENTPRLSNGDFDFESIDAVNVDLFNDHLKRLINGEEVSIPTFNFYKGKGEYLGNKIKLDTNDILIIEGLHAINEVLTSSVDKAFKFKVYISPLTDLNIDDHNIISNSDVRLLRRIVRDNRTRGYSALETISRWQDVRSGEEKNIFPYQNDVDYVFNSSLIYEIGVLKLFVEPLLFVIDDSSIYYEEVVRLLNFLDMFVGIPTDEIPSESILREFIGGSYFE